METEEVAPKSSKPRSLESLRLAFSSMRPVVKRLISLKHKDIDDEKWAETAVKILAKKLDKRRDDLEELERAISNPNRPSSCVTIPRNSDQGRLAVSYRKNHAHVIYCKLWRWPDLLWHGELRPSEYCKFPFHIAKPTKDICVNPYHYRRIDDPLLLTVLVPRRPASSDKVEHAAEDDINGYSAAPRNVSSEADWLNNCNDKNRALHSYAPDETKQAYPSTSQICEKATAVDYSEQENWASIAYYELNRRIGEIFQCSQPTVMVDGYTNPSSGSFCLGKLSNINRSSMIENVRRHIGKGVRLHYVGGELYAHCQSDSAIFVQSKNRNYEASFHPSTVIKMPPDCTLKIFDNRVFAELLKRSVQAGFESAYELTKMCTIRMSFVKGWGAEYQRQDVTSTPCWIEIHLNGPLRWLDDVLMSMSNSRNPVSSVS